MLSSYIRSSCNRLFCKDRYAPPLCLSSKLKTITIDGHSEDALDPGCSFQVILHAEALSLGLNTSDQWDIITNLTLPKLTSLCLVSPYYCTPGLAHLVHEKV